MATYTNDFLLRQTRKQFHVDQRRGHPFQGAELRVDSERKQHQKEQNGPQLGARKLVDGLSENYKSKSGARCALK